MGRFSHINSWVFDLDNTLYPAHGDVFAQIDKKMTAFISRYLALHPTQARILQKQYLVEYGTSLSGLMAVHGMDPADFLDYVHDVDLDMLKPDPRLRSGLSKLKGRKFLFTNGSRGHAKNIGEHLQIYDVFDGVFAIEDAHYIPKPKSAPYRQFIAEYDIDPARALMVEDTVRNLEVPKALGMATLLITSTLDVSNEPEACRPSNGTNIPDYVDAHTHDLPGWLLRL